MTKAIAVTSFIGLWTAVIIANGNAVVSAQRASAGREIIITDAVKRIQRDGYRVETHSVQTADGYSLVMHRIPKEGGKLTSLDPKSTIFLMTGIYGSTDAWLLNGPENSLPYLLSKRGYDVWMSNNRGNVYTRKKGKYSPDQWEFWNFSWHEMGVYDMPAMVDYVIERTGQKQMHFVGVSQGATVFLVMTAIYPQYNSVFKTATLLAPVAFISHMQAPMFRVFASIFGTQNYLTTMLEGVEMVSTNTFFKRLLSHTCLQNEPPTVCTSRILPVIGYDTKHLNKSLIPEIMANYPVGGSFKQTMHYFQCFNSGKFRQYDYGAGKNYLIYKQAAPPDYRLDRVTAPVFVYYSENDYIVSVKDIQRLVRRLQNVHGIYKIPLKRWNHLDFICGMDVRKFIFNKIVNTINMYEFKVE